MRSRGNDHYVCRIIDQAIQAKSPMGKRIKELENLTDSQSPNFRTTTRTAITTSDSSKRKSYLEINPKLEPTTYRSSQLPEHDRIAYTRMRLGSHHLKVETGRWARIPRENRLCQCGKGVQDEKHVLIDCPLSEHIRVSANHSREILSKSTIGELFNSLYIPLISLARYCNEILEFYRT